MTQDQAKKLPLCLCRLFWWEGGSSLASVGMLHDGKRWFAPTNWTGNGKMEVCTKWSLVERVEILHDGLFHHENDNHSLS